MSYDEDKVDEMAIALLYLTLSTDGHAWKGMDWDVSDRLYAKGWIENPKNKNLSFELTSAGREVCIRLFKQHFLRPSNEGTSLPLFALPVSLDALIWIYRTAATEFNTKPYYLDSATGEIVSDEPLDEDEIPEEKPDYAANRRYLLIPVQTDSTHHNDKWVRKFLTEWLASHGIKPK